MLSGVSVAIEFVLGLAAGADHGAQLSAAAALIMSILIVPLFISPVIVGQAWTLLLQRPFGPTNYILSQLLGQEVTISWLTESPWLYFSLIIADVWQWTPFMFVILLAGLTAIPPNLYEAAELDGVNAWQAFWAITAAASRADDAAGAHLPPARRDPHVRHHLHHDRRRTGHADLYGVLLSLHGRLHPVPSVAGDGRKLAVPDLHRARGDAAGAAAARRRSRSDGRRRARPPRQAPLGSGRPHPAARLLPRLRAVAALLDVQHLDQAERRLPRRPAGLVPRRADARPLHGGAVHLSRPRRADQQPDHLALRRRCFRRCSAR